MWYSINTCGTKYGHIHRFTGPILSDGVNDRLAIHNKFLARMKPEREPEVLPRMALTAYTATTTTKTTLLPQPRAVSGISDETLT